MTSEPWRFWVGLWIAALFIGGVLAWAQPTSSGSGVGSLAGIMPVSPELSYDLDVAPMVWCDGWDVKIDRLRC